MSGVVLLLSLAVVAASPVARPQTLGPQSTETANSIGGASLASIFQEILRDEEATALKPSAASGSTGAADIEKKDSGIDSNGNGPGKKGNGDVNSETAGEKGADNDVVEGSQSTGQQTDGPAGKGEDAGVGLAKGETDHKRPVVGAVIAGSSGGEVGVVINQNISVALSRYLPQLRRTLTKLLHQLASLEAAITAPHPGPPTSPPELERYVPALEALLADVLQQEAAAGSVTTRRPTPTSVPPAPINPQLGDLYTSLEETLKELLTETKGPTMATPEATWVDTRLKDKVETEAEPFMKQLEHYLASTIQETAQKDSQSEAMSHTTPA